MSSNNGTHEPNDGGVPLETNVQLGTRGISCVIKKNGVWIKIKNI